VRRDVSATLKQHPTTIAATNLRRAHTGIISVESIGEEIFVTAAFVLYDFHVGFGLNSSSVDHYFGYSFHIDGYSEIRLEIHYN
jgi:hypothetical protein